MLRRLSLACALALPAFAFAQTAPPAAPPSVALPPMGGVAPATMPATNPADVAAVRAALKKYNDAVAAGDVPTLTESISTTSEPQRKAMALMGRLTTSGRGIYSASVAKFTEAGLMAERVERRSFPGGFPELEVDAMEVKTQGDAATLVSRDPASRMPPLAMRRTAGVWKIDGDALLPPLTDKQIGEQTTVLESAIKAIDETAADITAGHIKSADEVVVLMNHRVQKAVQAAQMKLTPMEDPAMMAPPGPPNAGAATQPATMPAK